MGLRVARSAFNQQRQRCILARKGPSENVVCSSMRCVKLMSDDIVVSKRFVVARQGQSESDFCISMGCVNSMFDDIEVCLCCILARQGQSENDLMVSKMYLFFDL